jgi:TolB-like protein/DNA-binding winged helix-turn-helix (wHTH) protein/Tfp pilus assembly protein PilF
MEVPNPIAEIVRFGIFQLDLKARELHKAGVRVKLQDQPFRVLSLLVGRAGQVVTREELRENIWPSDVYVTFDQGLNNAIKKVRVALEDSADNPRFVETVAKRGYRFIAPVNAKRHGTADPASPWRITSFRMGLWVAVAAAVVLVAVAPWSWRRPALSSKAPSERVILAVLPFDNLSRDPEQDFFSDGLTEEMIAQIGKLNPQRLTVIARNSVARYKGSSLSASRIGADLRADYLVQGSVRRAANHVRITVQLIEMQHQTDLWAETYDREINDMLALQDSVARAIARQVNVSLASDQQARPSNPHTLSPEAYDAYLKGRYYWNKRTADGLQKACLSFQHAISEDPTYGAAYSGLADCNSGLTWLGFVSPAEALPKAYEAAVKAIELDPQSSEAHASLALVLHHRWDWPRAESEFKRALELGPQYANAHHWYGDYLSVKGRHDEALLEAKQALELDPLNLMIGTWVGLRYYLARDYDRAIEQSRTTVDLDPNFAAAHLVLGENLLTRQPQDALSEMQTAARLSGDSPLYLAQVAVADAMSGHKTEAHRLVAQLQQMSNERYVSPYGIAQVYAALNDQEHSIQWLQTAYDDRAVWMCYLAVDPLFDRFRSDPRFQDLLQRVGLRPSQKFDSYDQTVQR